MQKIRANITVVVLGDLGRSPRMQLHALALAQTVGQVTLVGEAGSRVYEAVARHPHIKLRLIHPWPKRESMKHSGLRSLLRVLWQAFRLLYILLSSARAQVILLQTPPALPSLSLCHWVAWIRSSRLVLDWHNFSYSVLARKLGKQHWLVQRLMDYEKSQGQKAQAHLCVSEDMRLELEKYWNINARVFFDRPGPMFKPLSPKQKTDCRKTFAKKLGLKTDSVWIVCPSSWNNDDDFSVLLQALPKLEQKLEQGMKQRMEQGMKQQAAMRQDCHFLLTGDGPGRTSLKSEFEQLRLKSIKISTPWLEADDYPLLLASCDLGLSLHRSTSKLDLPMKIVDMQGAGLPVWALNYGPCLKQQIHSGINGHLFEDAESLAASLSQLIQSNCRELKPMEQNVSKENPPNWERQWRQISKDVLNIEALSTS